jgi:hypothetical protein
MSSCLFLFRINVYSEVTNLFRIPWLGDHLLIKIRINNCIEKSFSRSEFSLRYLRTYPSFMKAEFTNESASTAFPCLEDSSLQYPFLADHSGMNSFRSLGLWDRGFENHSRHGCLYCVRLFYVCIVLCVGTGLATGWSSVQGVLSTVYRIKKLIKRPRHN